MTRCPGLASLSTRHARQCQSLWVARKELKELDAREKENRDKLAELHKEAGSIRARVAGMQVLLASVSVISAGGRVYLPPQHWNTCTRPRENRIVV